MKKVVDIAGPAGSGKNSVIMGLLRKIKNSADFVTCTTRKPRVGEVDGVDYFFLTNEQFLEEDKKGNILEKYYREDTDTWYGTQKSRMQEYLQKYDAIFGDWQIVGAKAMKENFNSLNIFILPESDEVMEKRIKGRDQMSEVEWQERLRHTKREIEVDAAFYDYRIFNKEGKLEETVMEVLEILRKEGFQFELV